MVHRFFIFLLALTGLLRSATPALAQGDAVVSDIVVAYDFGEQIIIRGGIQPAFSDRPLSIRLFLPDDPNTLTAPLTVDSTGTFTFIHLPADRFVRAFSDITFQFVVEQADGSLVESETFTFFYADNRFEWRTLEGAPFRVHWYAGDVSFAQLVLDAAARGLDRSQEYFSVQPPWIDIYVYADSETYRSVRGALGSLWAGGHVQPETGMIIAALPQGAEAALEIDRKIPHEVAHLALYLSNPAGFRNLPVWLNEGFASMMETYPNPDYAYLVSRAADEGSLTPLSELCASFPQETSGALLAYAQSDGVVRYLESAYGTAGIRALVESYADGAGCIQGPLVEPIRLDLVTLDAAWRSGIVPSAETETSGAAGVESAASAAAWPWLLMFAAVLVGPGLVLLGAGLKKGKMHD